VFTINVSNHNHAKLNFHENEIILISETCNRTLIGDNMLRKAIVYLRAILSGCGFVAFPVRSTIGAGGGSSPEAKGADMNSLKQQLFFFYNYPFEVVKLEL